MRKSTVIVISVILAISVTGFLYARANTANKAKTAKAADNQKEAYYCAMHPDFISDKPGNCLICGMTLVKKEGPSQAKAKDAKTKILFYRNPMNPEVTSPVPMKDSMGMDYVPVYKEESDVQASGIYISPEKQQLIGVTKEKIEKRKLNHQIITVCKIAYDPDLYVAQSEYIQASKTLAATENSVLPSIKEQSKSFLNAAEKKLLLLGMTKDQIDELAKNAAPQENLYLPGASTTVWVYLTIYEYELGLIKEGQEVQIDTVAFPGELFKGKISSITPVLDPLTRSAQVRVEVDDSAHKLKPQMYVNAKIQIDLGEVLAMPEEAVLDTGLRKIVYVAKEGDILEAREVTLGQKAQGYYEVLSGINAGDVVVTSGNFLVDSESKLRGVVTSK